MIPENLRHLAYATCSERLSLYFGCDPALDDGSSREHDWGWEFVFVPRHPAQRARGPNRATVYWDRESGRFEITPNNLRRLVYEVFSEGKSLYFGCDATLDDSLSREHDWGWEFVFVPRDPTLCTRSPKRLTVIWHRESGEFNGVGTRGVEGALFEIELWKQGKIDPFH